MRLTYIIIKIILLNYAEGINVLLYIYKIINSNVIIKNYVGWIWDERYNKQKHSMMDDKKKLHYLDILAQFNTAQLEVRGGPIW